MRDHLKIRLVLMELVIAILFFAVSISVCIQLFVFAFTKSNDAQQLNQSVFAAQGIAEVYKNTDGDVNKVAEYYDAQLINSDYVLYLDAYGNQCNKEDYILEIKFTEKEPDENQLTVTVHNSKKEIYTIDVVEYNPKKGGTK